MEWQLDSSESTDRNRSSVAEAYLHGGLKLFLGTDWPVDDRAALTFSQSIDNHLSVDHAVNLVRQAVK